MTGLDVFQYAGQQVDVPGDRLYAIELGDVVKVGRSSRINHRLQTHAAHAGALGVVVGRVWVGDVGSGLAERALIEECSRIAEPRSREYFPIPLERVVQIAIALDWASLQRDEDARAPQAEALIDALKSDISGGAIADPYEVAMDLIDAWREFDAEGYKRIASTRTSWALVALFLTQRIVGHSAAELIERAEIEELREMWESEVA